MPTPVLAELSAGNWITAAALAVGTLVVSYLVRKITKQRAARQSSYAELIDALGRVLIVVVLAIGVYYTSDALDIQLGPALGALGIGALFIAVGLQPFLVNFVGSVLLQARRPFRRGDQILSNGFEGTVIDVTSTATVLLSYDGEAIHIPNSDVIGSPLVNWTHEPVRRTILPISVPYGCELPKVLATVGKAARQALDDDNLPPAEALALGFGAHGIDIELRFWHYSDQLESNLALNMVVCAIDEALKAIDVVIPFNQLVIHQDSPRAEDS